MNIIELQNRIKNDLIIDGEISVSRIRKNSTWFEKNDIPDYRKDIIQKTKFLKDCSLTQRIWHIINNKMEKFYCVNCQSEETKFLTFNKGYRKYCLFCGNRIVGNISNFKQTVKNNNTNQIVNIISHMDSDNILSKKETIESIMMYIDFNYSPVWKKKGIVDNDVLLSSIIYHTKFISYENISKLVDFNISERIYCLLNNIKSVHICLSCDNKTSFIDFNKGYRKYCSSMCAVGHYPKRRIKTTEKKIIKRLNDIDCDLVNDYNGYNNYTTVKCNKCNETFSFNFPCGSWFRDTICPSCNKDKTKSSYEYEIIDFLKSHIQTNIVHSHRVYINGIKYYELDIFLPEYKYAIEFNGLYWHSENNGNKDKQYHLNKTSLCNNKNIQLIHIFSNEWLHNKEIIKSLILAKLGIFKQRIYARKCIVKEISTIEKDQFLEINHRQGKDKSSVKLGLYYDNSLVSVMTFGKRQISRKNVLEMIRYCTKCYVQIIGGASKLFSYFRTNYWKGEDIYSYADRRWSNGRLYDKLGFTLSHISSPNYWYTKDYNTLCHRVSFQKHKLKDKLEIFNSDLTEWENMKLNNYDRIWDCGNYVYVYK